MMYVPDSFVLYIDNIPITESKYKKVWRWTYNYERLIDNWTIFNSYKKNR